MRNLVDLHCHWVAGIDDGARTPAEGVAMLRGLYDLGFDTVVATPHMRPGLFDNTRTDLECAFRSMQPTLSAAAATSLPAVYLASEHFFDDVVFVRLVGHHDALPYPGGRCALVEFGRDAFPMRVQHRFFDMQRAGVIPVLAHPERYQPVWDDDACLEPLLDAGALLLLDLCSLTGKYGRAPQRAAEKLLEEDAYEAACTDAHRPSDVDAVAHAIDRLERLAGGECIQRLLADGPRSILLANMGSS